MKPEDLEDNLPERSEDDAPRKKPKWGRTMKVSLGVLGGLGLLMGYVSAAGMQQSEQEAGARKAIDDFIAALNARNLDAARRALHYPHVHFAGNEIRIWNCPDDFYIDFDALSAAEGWDHSTLDLCVARLVSPEKAHFEVQFSRQNADSERYATYQSLWIVTRKDGHWGVQCRSILSA